LQKDLCKDLYDASLVIRTKLKNGDVMINSYKILGVEVHPATITDLNNLVIDSIEKNKKTIISSQNLHSVYIFNKDAKLRAFNDRTIKRVDGMPFIILGKLMGYPLNKEQRVTWVDYMIPFLKTISDNEFKLFYLGSKPKIADKAIEIFRNKFPGIKIAYANGYFNKVKESWENTELLKMISDFKPDALLVGMGMPIQEHWIYDNLNEIDAKVILTCGAAVEYFTGEVSTPPRWMGKVGLEWLYRLSEDPKRFYKRYCIEPLFLIPLIVKDLIQAIKNRFNHEGNKV
jgi:N-acetylglucosaminyldiphosphoundecaprenol N-acetyl-beta-D-mannosaminyltransferase